MLVGGQPTPRSLQQPFELHKNEGHPRDCVRLQESNHIYFNLQDHKKRYTSVTTFIGGFFSKFDGLGVIQKRYDNWQIVKKRRLLHGKAVEQKNPYYFMPIDEFLDLEGATTVGHVKVRCLHGKVVPRENIHYTMPIDEFLAIEGATVVDEKHRYYGMSQGEILLRWNENGAAASENGTRHHNNIEEFYNETGKHKDTPEFRLFLEIMAWESALRPLIPYRMEWIIYSEKLQLAGSMDGLFKLPAGHPHGLPDRESYVILDWKFIKKYDGPIPGKAPPSWARFAQVGSQKLLECHYTKYRIQLLIYAYILETEYDMAISGMANVAFNPDGIDLPGVTPRRKNYETGEWESYGKNTSEYLPYQRDDPLVAELIQLRLSQLGQQNEMDPAFMYGSLLPHCESLREWNLDAWDGVPLAELEAKEKEDEPVTAKRPREDAASDSDVASPSKKLKTG